MREAMSGRGRSGGAGYSEGCAAATDDEGGGAAVDERGEEGGGDGVACAQRKVDIASGSRSAMRRVPRRAAMR
jgi:hypothetical protein